MRTSKKYAVNVAATGFVVLLLLSIVIFWVLKIGQVAFYEELVVFQTGKMSISPSGVLPKEIEFEPNVVKQSEIKGDIGDGGVYGTFGLFQDVIAEEKSRILLGRAMHGQVGTKNVYIDSYDARNDVHTIVYFDKKLGLFVMCEIYYRIGGDKNKWVKNIHLYAGPNGVSVKDSNNLGRFTKPLVDLGSQDMTSFIIFDSQLSRFFKIDFVEQQVAKGPQIKDLRPVAIGGPGKNEFGVWSFAWIPPLRNATKEELADRLIPKYTRVIDDQSVQLVAVDGLHPLWRGNPSSTLVLTASSEIFRLNEDSLEPDEQVGALLDENLEPVSPSRLLGYMVINPTRGDERFGTAVGQVSADAHQLSAYTFDENGSFRDLYRYNILESYAKAGGPLYLVGRYVVENLRPPILSLVSYFTASSFEATAGHQALFLVPESFTGWHSRSTPDTVGSFLLTFIIISPSLLLGGLIAWFIRKDAIAIGLSRRTVGLWVVTAVAFGLVAGITYLLTRDNNRLVTCQNCGKMRRPDMETCHRCGASWDVPELRAVCWRVSDS